MTFVAAAVMVVGGTTAAVMAGKAKQEAEKKEMASRNEMMRQKQIFQNLDTSNPYLNMENVMEDLTINQQQYALQKQQSMQAQSNILASMRGAAGGSGVASLAQAMANSGNLASQQAAASIGQQEALNQQAERSEAGRLQDMERQGDLLSRSMERDKVSTLLGMAQQETGAHREAAQAAQQAMISSVMGAASGAAGSISSWSAGQQDIKAAEIKAQGSSYDPNAGKRISKKSFEGRVAEGGYVTQGQAEAGIFGQIGQGGITQAQLDAMGIDMTPEEYNVNVLGITSPGGFID